MRIRRGRSRRHQGGLDPEAPILLLLLLGKMLMMLMLMMLMMWRRRGGAEGQIAGEKQEEEDLDEEVLMDDDEDEEETTALPGQRNVRAAAAFTLPDLLARQGRVPHHAGIPSLRQQAPRQVSSLPTYSL